MVVKSFNHITVFIVGPYSQLIPGGCVTFHFSSVSDTNCWAVIYKMKTPEAEGGLFLIMRSIKTHLARFFLS